VFAKSLCEGGIIFSEKNDAAHQFSLDKVALDVVKYCQIVPHQREFDLLAYRREVRF